MSITFVSTEYETSALRYLMRGRITGDDRYFRKGHSVPREVPADEQARYEAALAGMKALEEYEGTEWGGPDYDTVIHAPDKFDWVWDETEEEYEARVKELEKGRA